MKSPWCKRAARSDRIGLAGVLLAGLVFSAEGASQNELRTRVAIVAPPASVTDQDELRTLLRAELLANGFEVVAAEAARDRGVVDPRASVEAALEECDAVAAFALVNVDDGSVVDVWLSDAVTDKTLVRRFAVGGQHEGRLDPSLLAVQAVELLRASLIELDPLKRVQREPRNDEAKPATECHGESGMCSKLPQRPAVGVATGRGGKTATEPPSNTPGVPTAPADEPGHSAVVAGAIAVGWVNGVGAQAGSNLALGYVSPFGLGARVALLGPMLGEGIEAAHGTAVVRETKILAAATYRFWAVPALFTIEPQLAGGANRVHLEGHAEAPFEPTMANMWTFVADAGANGALWVDPRFAIELGLHAAVSLPPIELRIASEAAATVDLPILYATAGVLVAP